MTKLKTIAAAAMVAIIMVPTLYVATASAGDRHYRSRGGTVHHHHYHTEKKRHKNAEAALIGGAVGLAAGVIIGDSLNRPVYERPSYYRPRVVYETRPVYRRRVRERVYYEPVYTYRPPRPWTSAWYDYCEAKYRSFDPESGTFQPHRGSRRLCR